MKNTALITRKSEWGLALWPWGAGLALTGKGREAGNVLYLDPGGAYPGVHICKHLWSIQNKHGPKRSEACRRPGKGNQAEGREDAEPLGQQQEGRSHWPERSKRGTVRCAVGLVGNSQFTSSSLLPHGSCFCLSLRLELPPPPTTFKYYLLSGYYLLKEAFLDHSRSH